MFAFKEEIIDWFGPKQINGRMCLGTLEIKRILLLNSTAISVNAGFCLMYNLSANSKFQFKLFSLWKKFS